MILLEINPSAGTDDSSQFLNFRPSHSDLIVLERPCRSLKSVPLHAETEITFYEFEI
jgi:hypothetical protein